MPERPKGVGRNGSKRAMRALTFLAITLVVSVAAAQHARFSAPADARPARRAALGDRPLLDCTEHGVWRAPEGWTTGAVRRETFAIAPDGTAVLLRVQARPRLRTDDDFVQQVRAVLGAWVEGASEGELTSEARTRWSTTRRLSGSAAGVTWVAEATRSSHFHLRIRASTAHDAAMDAAIGSWAMLTSHACQCGTDCDRRPRE